jgi:FixJ family two-component response regulator
MAFDGDERGAASPDKRRCTLAGSATQWNHPDGLTAQSFEDAEAFFAYSRSHAVSLASVDVWMPETSGLQVQARLREVSPGTKVIMMTGRETAAIRAAALKAGAFTFLVKPFDDEAFLCLVRQHSSWWRDRRVDRDHATPASPQGTIYS